MYRLELHVYEGFKNSFFISGLNAYHRRQNTVHNVVRVKQRLTFIAMVTGYKRDHENHEIETAILASLTSFVSPGLSISYSTRSTNYVLYQAKLP